LFRFCHFVSIEAIDDGVAAQPGAEFKLDDVVERSRNQPVGVTQNAIAVECI
jgi:hypothetical protein